MKDAVQDKENYFFAERVAVILRLFGRPAG